MKAIIELCGKQYWVEPEKIIYFEKLESKPGDEVVFENVVYVDGIFGRPYVKKAKVKGIVEKQGKDKKIIVFKYKPKKNYHKKQGHKQLHTRVKITEVSK